MPATEENAVRDLLHRYADQVYPSPAIATEVAARQHRRDRRHRIAGLAAAGTALSAAAGVIAAAPGHTSRPPGPAAPAIRLTADQRVLYHLSSVAATRPPGQGRYAVMSTAGDHLRDTSVIDSRTGNMWSYQQGRDGNPSGRGFSRRYSPTSADFAALPTTPAALRAALVAQWDKQNKPVQNPLWKLTGATPVRRRLTVSVNDKVFQQASDMLWNPLVGPALRSALYKLLANVPGVTVNPAVHDRLGRAAVEISRTDTSGLPGGKSDGISYATYESPSTGAVLESTVTYPPGSDLVTPQDPHGTRTVVDTTVYLRLTWATAIPADPYGR